MRPFPETRDHLLERPFLTEAGWGPFGRRLDEVLGLIGDGQSVLCVEEDPIRALAVIFATVLKKGGVFLANPKWRSSEWEAVDKLTGFHQVFGDCPIQPDTTRAASFCESRFMIPSGGTSGKVRFCVHSSDTLAAAVKSLYNFHGEKPLNSINPLPVFHVSGLMPVLRACLTGGRTGIANWKTIESGSFPSFPGEPSSISLVPAQLARTIKTEEGLRFLHGFVTIYLGGAGTPPDLIRFIRSEKLPVLFVYGMTETAAMVVAGSRADTDSMGNLWGQPLPGVSVSLPEDQEIHIQTQSLFRGYFPDDAKVSDFATGDVGQWTVDHQIQVLGRKDFLINSGGEKVNPEEVEAILRECLPGVKLAVAGRCHAEWGEQVVALVEVDLSSDSLERLRQKLEVRLAVHKIPAEFIKGIMIPLNALGKVDRAALKAIISGG
ncbi:MAG: AMP-binding protein [Verrucomicrobia bacterium]|nr:AMP-binding protein [Verrucomicrobiota bacterium]